MAILRPDTTTTLIRVKINEYLLTRHNPNRIAMPSVSMEGKNYWRNSPQYSMDHDRCRNDTCGAVYSCNRQWQYE